MVTVGLSTRGAVNVVGAGEMVMLPALVTRRGTGGCSSLGSDTSRRTVLPLIRKATPGAKRSPRGSVGRVSVVEPTMIPAMVTFPTSGVVFGAGAAGEVLPRVLLMVTLPPKLSFPLF